MSTAAPRNSHVDGEYKVLIVDDEAVIHVVFADLLGDEEYRLSVVSSAEEALDQMKKERFDLAIVDKNLPGISGLRLIGEARALQPQLEIILMTGYASYESAVEALRLGAIDYVAKPFRNLQLIKATIDQALERQPRSDHSEVLVDYLAVAHPQLRQMAAAFCVAVGELKIENTELRQGINNILELLNQSPSRLHQLAATRDDNGEGLARMHRLEQLDATAVFPPIRTSDPSAHSAERHPGTSLAEVMRETERRLIQDAMMRCNNVLTRAAELLGVQVSTLHKKIKRLESSSSNGTGRSLRS